jgi:hypothetical protein
VILPAVEWTPAETLCPNRTGAVGESAVTDWLGLECWNVGGTPEISEAAQLLWFRVRVNTWLKPAMIE